MICQDAGFSFAFSSTLLYFLFIPLFENNSPHLVSCLLLTLTLFQILCELPDEPLCNINTKIILWMINVNAMRCHFFVLPSESNYILCFFHHMWLILPLWNDVMKSGVKLPLWLHSHVLLVEWQALENRGLAKAWNCIIANLLLIFHSSEIFFYQMNFTSHVVFVSVPYLLQLCRKWADIKALFL